MLPGFLKLMSLKLIWLILMHIVVVNETLFQVEMLLQDDFILQFLHNYTITKSMRALCLVNQLWFIVGVNS